MKAPDTASPGCWLGCSTTRWATPHQVVGGIPVVHACQEGGQERRGSGGVEQQGVGSGPLEESRVEVNVERVDLTGRGGGREGGDLTAMS